MPKVGMVKGSMKRDGSPRQGKVGMYAKAEGPSRLHSNAGKVEVPPHSKMHIAPGTVSNKKIS